jgi:hypothetical protein
MGNPTLDAGQKKATPERITRKEMLAELRLYVLMLERASNRNIFYKKRIVLISHSKNLGRIKPRMFLPGAYASRFLK